MLKTKQRKKNIIITGAYGQDGIILSKLLSKKNYKVIGLVRHLKKIKIRNVKYIKSNLSNFGTISKIVNNLNPKALIHFGSANPSFYENKKLNRDFYIKNFKEAKNLIDIFTYLKKSKLILIGSSQMYKNGILKINLKTKFTSTTPYTKFRINAFNYMIRKKKKFNSNMVMAILFNHDSVYRNKKFLIPRLIKIVKDKNLKKLQEIHNENISGDFSHADDICNGLFKLINTKVNPDKLIFSSNKRTFVNDIIKYLIKTNKLKNIIDLKPKTKKFSSIGDNLFTKKLLNWKLEKNIFVAVKELNKLH